MNINTVWSIYFSATGTTKTVAVTLGQALAELLGAEYREAGFTLPRERERTWNLSPEDLAVVGVPVYAGRVPNLLLPYIKDGIKGRNTLAVPVVLFGNRDFDDGLIELRDVLWDNGLRPVSAGAFVGEHAFSRCLGAGRPDEEDLTMVKQLAEQTAQKVHRLETPPEQQVRVEGCKSGPALLHPQRPVWKSDQYPEGQAQNTGGPVCRLRLVCPSVPHGIDRPGAGVTGNRSVHQMLCLCKELPCRSKIL